uniref:Nipsnap homolog 3A (C. elegans) n=1 Tax=Echeneis naucrates TaxID=173247 RepID=A0A665U0S4_ECHNA
WTNLRPRLTSDLDFETSSPQLSDLIVSTRPQQDDQTFYEFRTYNIRPDQTAAFLKLTNEKIHLRTAHSQLIGYWNVEFGGLNQVFHIWKYDSYSQRAAVRAALAQDPCWISEYISKAIPMLNSQDNEVNYMVPWTQLQSPLQEVHVLWWFQDADHRAELRRLSHSDARVVAAVRNSFGHLDSQRNILMFPCPFSPMK